ncbi:alpha/beta hydrolase [Actinomycetospora sp. NBRC 106375]|uniref:alpha/beta fold hydrolase n=1 Tax=Actinomycetospora sp. NBRC 106375 TaxID=3032207 RepID=UPI0024A0BDF7|nr:alpha/beta hydrolase [Actinomycetospora sp. NBRC 106375]GLZ46310.1 alpha/beta hydrolase [Actinomycetospora sp. NBRC 106375]
MQVNGKELAVEVDGDGPAVLLVHGLGGTSTFFQPQVAALAERFTVIRPDMEGSGRSPATGTLSIEGFANDLAALLEALDAGPARVVGHSMGTITVRSLAARRPELVSHLALLGAVPAPLPEAGQQGQHDRAAKVRAGGLPDVATAVMTNATAEATRRDHPGTAAAVRELVLRQDPEGYARSCEALAGANDAGPISRELPLLLLTGADDGVGAPAVTQALADAHGSAVVDVFDDCGHWTALEKPHEVTEHLLKFF